MRRVVTNLLDLRDGGQHQAPARHALAASQLTLHFLRQRGVQRRLLRGHVHGDDVLGFIRKIINNRRIRLQPAQDKRCGQALQALAHFLAQLIITTLNRLGKVIAEKRLRAQHPRVDKIQQAAQLTQLVLHRCAGQCDALTRRELSHAFRRPRARILNRLRLIQHHVIPLHLRQGSPVTCGNAVGGDHQIGFARGLDQLLVFLPARTVMHQHLHVRHEAYGFTRPVAHHRGWRDHNRRRKVTVTVLRRGVFLHSKQRQQLQRFAQAHVICQHSTQVVTGHEIQPVHAAALVITQ